MQPSPYVSGGEGCARGNDLRRLRPAIALALMLAGCGTPAVLTAPPISAGMELVIAPPRPGVTSLPVPAIAEPTGEAPITLPDPDPTPPAAPRSDQAGRP
jgi:hypothetical protein